MDEVKIADLEAVLPQDVVVGKHLVLDSAYSVQKVLHKALLDSSSFGRHREWVLGGHRAFRDLRQEGDQFHLYLKWTLFQATQPGCKNLGQSWEKLITDVDQDDGFELGDSCQRLQSFQSLEQDYLIRRLKTPHEEVSAFKFSAEFDGARVLLLGSIDVDKCSLEPENILRDLVVVDVDCHLEQLAKYGWINCAELNGRRENKEHECLE